MAFLSALISAMVLCFAVLGLSSSAVVMSNGDETLDQIGFQRPIAALQLSETFPLTYHVFLPIVGRDPLPITETLKSKYLFVEHWATVERSEQCSYEGLASLPTYSFSPLDGKLTIYVSSPELKLQTDDVGYIGCGVGGGGYYANYLYKFRNVPFSACSL